MPFMDEDQWNGIYPTMPVVVPQPRPAPSLGDTLEAAASENSTLAAINGLRSAKEFPPEPQYNAFRDDALTGNEDAKTYLQRNPNAFLYSNSSAESQDIIAKIHKQEKDDATIAASGWAGTVATLAAGTLDLPNALPIGEIYGATKLGRALSGAVRVAGANAASSAIQEGILRGAQPGRTDLQSAMSIGGATVVGGLLGGAIGAMGGSAAAKVARELDGVDRARVIAQPLGGERIPVGELDHATGELHLPEDIANTNVPSNAFQSTGAAAVEGADTTLKQGWGGATISKYTAFMTPLQRVQNSISEKARYWNAVLFDPGGTRLVANTEEGGFHAMAPGGTVQTRVEAQVGAIHGQFVDDMKQIYGEYYRDAGGGDSKLGMMWNTARRDLLNAQESGPLSMKQISEQAIEEYRAHGKSDDAFRQRMIDAFVKSRDQVKDIAKSAGYEIQDDAVKFAAGYVPRIYVRKAVADQTVALEDAIFGNMKAAQEQKFRLQQQMLEQKQAMEGADSEAKKLASRQETAQRRMTDAEARAAEVSSTYGMSRGRADTAEERLAALEGEISDLRDHIETKREDKTFHVKDLRALEKELTTLNRARETLLRRAKEQPNTPMTDYKAMPKGTLPDSFSTTRFQEYVTGERGAPREPSIIQWIIDNGGIRDTGGDIRAMFGGRPPSGLIRDGADSFDKWAVKYGERVGRSSENWEDSFKDILANAAGDRTWRPQEWRDAYGPELQQRLVEHEAAQHVREEMFRRGLDPADKNQLVQHLRGDDIHNLPGKIGSQDPVNDPFGNMGDIPIDPVQEYAGMDARAGIAKDNAKAADRAIATLKRKLQSKDVQTARAEGKADEAAVQSRAARSRLEILMDRAERYAAIDSDLTSKLDALAKDKLASREKLEKLLTQWEGKSAKEAKAKLEERAKLEAIRQEAIKAGTYKGRGERLGHADSAVDDSVKSIVDSVRDKPDAELRDMARDVVSNLRGSPDGRMPYEWGAAATGDFAGKQELPRFLKERDMPLHDSELTKLGVLENDPFHVLHSYAHSMISQAEIGRVFKTADGKPDPSMGLALREIKEEYANLHARLVGDRQAELIRGGMDPAAAAAKAEADAPKLRQQLQGRENADIRDMIAMRDRTLGVYGLPSDPDSLFHRGATVARDWNYLTKMGSMLLAQIPDMGNAVIRYGLGKVLDAMVEKLQRATPEAVSASERAWARDAGLTMEVLVGTRSAQMGEIVNDFGRHSAFERSVRTGAQVMSIANLSRHWDDMAQSLVSTVGLRRIMRNAEEWATTGTLASNEAEWMASHQIGMTEAKRIWNSAISGEGERWKGVLMPEGRTWKDKGAYDMVRFALRQAADDSIIKPGQDKPLWASTPTGKLFAQFRTFFIASQQRILIAGLQQADRAAAEGIVTTFVLGMLTEALYDLARDGAIKKRNASEWAIQGFDRGSLGGWLMEANNTAEKVTGNRVGIRGLTGATEPAPRYQSRSAIDSVMGPTFGFASDAVKAANGLSSGDMGRSDLRNLRNMLPGQNHILFRRPFDAMQNSIGDWMGMDPPKPKPKEKHSELSPAAAAPQMPQNKRVSLARNEAGRIVGATGAADFRVARDAQGQVAGISQVG